MRGALYLGRGTGRRTWRAVLALALLGGLLGAVALAALAGARRTATAYDRYLRASRASDTLINVPGLLPGVPPLEPSDRIAALPAVQSAATYIGLNCLPVVRGQVRSAFLTNGVNGSLGEYFSQDQMTVLAGCRGRVRQLPPGQPAAAAGQRGARGGRLVDLRVQPAAGGRPAHPGGRGDPVARLGAAADHIGPAPGRCR
jgi:hypothetical protein